MFHTGDTYNPRGKLRYAHPLNIDVVAVDNPGLKLVICHVGNPWILDCMETVYKNKNVYADISGLVLGDFESKFKKFVLRHVRDMILYAGTRILMKGAPDRLLDRCAQQRGASGEIEPMDRKSWEGWIDTLGGQGLRVLAAARPSGR